ncbi:MAG: hypothetical protein J6331_04830 [Lentisphaeria bacterium]|nr:hypothetical protein [Lentisphaeria bacterium]
MGDEAKKKSLETLIEEFEKSNLSVDEFCKKYLTECGVEKPEETLQAIDATFAGIEKHYDAIQENRKKGGTRAQYLSEVCDPVLGKTSPENAGNILSAIIQAICGKKGDPGLTVGYTDEESRGNAMKALEEALKDTTIKGIAQNEENGAEN